MVRKGDTVIVTTGKDKGKVGKVLRVDLARQRAYVEKVNIVKRHMRPTPQMRQGGIVEKEASIHVSNLMPYCEETQKGSRVRHEEDNKGKKVRVLVASGAKLD